MNLKCTDYFGADIIRDERGSILVAVVRSDPQAVWYPHRVSGSAITVGQFSNRETARDAMMEAFCAVD